MDNKGQTAFKIFILIVLISLIALIVSAGTGRTIQGTILKNDSNPAENATVIVHTRLDGDCNCSTLVSSVSYTDSNGEYTEASNNFRFDAACASEGTDPGDDCDGYWDDNDELWITVDGSTVIPISQGNSTSPINTTFTWDYYYIGAPTFADVVNGTLDLPPQPNLVVSKTDSPDPVENGTSLNYTILINNTGNGTAINVTLFETYPTNVTFVSSTPSANQSNNTWYVGNLNSGSSTTVNITVMVNGNLTNNSILTNMINVTYQSTTSDYSITTQTNTTVFIVDNPPYWNNNLTNIVSTYSPTTLSFFNISWLDDFGVSIVWFESNYSSIATNYSMNRINGTTQNGIYNYSAILPAGTHYWKSYANDTINQWNETGQWDFTINKASPSCTLEISSSPVVYGTQTQANCSCTNSETIAVLYRNGTDVTATENGTLTTLPGGNWYYECNSSATQNYTSATNTSWINVTQALTSTTLYINGSTSDFTQNVSFDANITCVLNISGNVNITQDGSQIAYGASPLQNISTYSSVANYTINCNYTGNENYTSSSDSSIIQAVDQINPAVVLDSPPDNYANDTSDPVNVTFTCNATDNLALSNISLYITNSSNQSFSLNQTTTISGTSNSTNWTLELSNGNYTWNCLAYDTSGNNDWGDSNRSIKVNYTAPTANYNFTYLINETTTTNYGYLNGTLNGTVYNDSIGGMQLIPGNNGTYTSEIFDVNSNRVWVNISWLSNAYGQLPSNRVQETSFASQNIDMAGNVLLLHLDNNSNYGETDSLAYDFSGSGHNASLVGGEY
ncbi:MAG: DUF11 domain-containing protein, partial [Nanoarchaeota archaeon]|nr:DUF11 domain-containing protein [Nanoarchaeota archaeon]